MKCFWIERLVTLTQCTWRTCAGCLIKCFIIFIIVSLYTVRPAFIKVVNAVINYTGGQLGLWYRIRKGRCSERQNFRSLYLVEVQMRCAVLSGLSPCRCLTLCRLWFLNTWRTHVCTHAAPCLKSIWLEKKNLSILTKTRIKVLCLWLNHCNRCAVLGFHLIDLI